MWIFTVDTKEIFGIAKGVFMAHKYAVGDVVVIHGRIKLSYCAQCHSGEKTKIIECKETTSPSADMSGRYYVVSGLREGYRGVYEEEIDLGEEDNVLKEYLQKIELFIKETNQKKYKHQRSEIVMGSIVIVKKISNSTDEPYWSWCPNHSQAIVTDPNPGSGVISNSWFEKGCPPAHVECFECKRAEYIPKKYLEIV